MEEDITARIVPLQEVYILAHELAIQIMQSEFSFDIIIAVARGGALPSRFMCDFLNINRMTSIQIRHYTSGAEELKQAKVIDPIRADIKNKNVLIVDDVNDSGQTLHAAVDHLKDVRPALLKTAVLHEKAGTEFTTDFHADKLKEWKWLIYQWAATEDVLEFLNKDDMLDQSPETARTYLAEKYDLEIEEDFFKRIIQVKNSYLETSK